MDRQTINSKFKELAQYKLMEAEAKAAKEAIEAEIKAYMESENIESLIGDEHKATYKEVVSNRFDSAAFKKDGYADLYKAYQKPSASMRFNFA